MLDLTNLALNLPVFALVLFRAGGIIVAAPLLSSATIPVRVKVVLALILALIMYPLASRYAGPLPTSVVGCVPLVLREVGLGLVMGFAGGLVLAALQAAGGLVAQQVGLTLSEIASPSFDEETDEITVLFEILGVLLFLAVDGHHWFIEGLAVSYREIPLGQATLRPHGMESMTNSFCALFVYALRGAAPLIAIMFLVNVIIAIMAKAVPEMNILMVGYPVKVFIGVLAMTLTFPLMWPVMREALGGLRDQLMHFVRLL